MVIIILLQKILFPEIAFKNKNYVRHASQATGSLLLCLHDFPGIVQFISHLLYVLFDLVSFLFAIEDCFYKVYQISTLMSTPASLFIVDYEQYRKKKSKTPLLSPSAS